MPKTSEFAKVYNSFSGVDIKGVFADRVIAELQDISYVLILLKVFRSRSFVHLTGSASRQLIDLAALECESHPTLYLLVSR